MKFVPKPNKKKANRKPKIFIDPHYIPIPKVSSQPNLGASVDFENELWTIAPLPDQDSMYYSYCKSHMTQAYLGEKGPVCLLCGKLLSLEELSGTERPWDYGYQEWLESRKVNVGNQLRDMFLKEL